MQYAIEIGSSGNFRVSQGSVETYLMWAGAGKSLYCCLQNFLRNVKEPKYTKFHFKTYMISYNL